MLETKEVINVFFGEFINVFFIPLISLYIYCIRNQRKLSFSGANFTRYGIMMVLNVLISDLFVKFIQIIHVIDFSKEGTKYGILAMIVAVMIPYAIEILKKCTNVNLEIEAKNA